MIYLQPPPVQDDPEVILVEHQNGKGLNGDVVVDNEEEAMLPKETSKKSWVLIKKYSIHISTYPYYYLLSYYNSYYNIRTLC